MEHLAGLTLVKKNKEQVSADDSLADKEIIAFYFSAHWCPPCRMFTPILADFYEEIKDQELPLEIVFVSSDETEEGLFGYMNEAHGDWLAVPFGSPAAEKLSEKFGIQGIPALVVTKKDGTVVSENGRGDVEKKGVNAYKDWSK